MPISHIVQGTQRQPDPLGIRAYEPAGRVSPAPGLLGACVLQGEVEVQGRCRGGYCFSPSDIGTCRPTGRAVPSTVTFRPQYKKVTMMAFPGLLEGQRNQPKRHVDLFPRSWLAVLMAHWNL